MPITETDIIYYRRRAAEERDAAERAVNDVPRTRHAELAYRYAAHADGLDPAAASVRGTFAI